MTKRSYFFRSMLSKFDEVSALNGSKLPYFWGKKTNILIRIIRSRWGRWTDSRKQFIDVPIKMIYASRRTFSFSSIRPSAASDGYWANNLVLPAWRTTFLSRMLLYIVCWLMFRRYNSYVLIGVRIIHFRI